MSEAPIGQPAGGTGVPERIGLLLAIALPAALVAFWASPRAARPTEMPPLALSATDVRASLAREIAGAEEDDPREARRRALYLAHGLAEVHADESPDQAAARRTELARLVAEIEADGGDEAIASARASDLARLMPALRATGQDAELDATERARELGLFPTMLTRYGAIVDGRRVAPEIVVHEMFVARWNAIHGRPMTEGMDETALRAYFGWLALEGGDAPIGMRTSALDRYAEAHGSRALEARGTLAYEVGDFATARRSFEEAYALTGSVRLRNHALASELAMSEAADSAETALPETVAD